MRHIHPAVRGFDRAAKEYEHGRPDYPPAAIRHLARVLGIGRGSTVVELGSGTGKFTRAMRAIGAALVPTEPAAGMRREFSRRTPELPILDGTAEEIPVPDRFADAVVAAQSFHWFRARAALGEIARVLRPGGGLGLVWNVRDETVTWVRELTRILRPYGWAGPLARQRRWKRAFDERRVPFGPLERRSFSYEQRADRATILARFLSVSCVAVRPARERRRVATEIRELLDSSPETRGRAMVSLPYRTDVYWSLLR